MHGYWHRNGPPLPVAVQIIGQALGIDWKLGPDMSDIAAVEPSGPTIAELAASGLMPL